MPVEKVIFRLANSLHVHVERHIFHADRDSVILINGALATTASFGQTIKYMSEHYNVLCFDLPYAGQSRQHNKKPFLLSKDDEVDILLELICRFKPGYLCSVSWGGLAALLALSRGASSIRRATICSFSPHLNDAMVRYVSTARDLLLSGESKAAANLLNDTVGHNLPRIVKLLNYRYLASLSKEVHEQLVFHIDQILALQPDAYLRRLANIRCQVKFINGMLDKHTTAREIRQMATYVKDAQFAVIPNAGHFLDLEGRPQAAAVREEILSFYGDPVQAAPPFVVAGQATRSNPTLLAANPRIRLRPSVPMHPLLPRCAAIVHHGGIGTAALAFASGIPQVVTPFAHDQFDNAARIEKTGCGLRIDGPANGRAIATALRHVTRDRSVAAQCVRTRQRIVCAPDASVAAAQYIERFAPPVPAAAAMDLIP